MKFPEVYPDFQRLAFSQSFIENNNINLDVFLDMNFIFKTLNLISNLGIFKRAFQFSDSLSFHFPDS